MGSLSSTSASTLALIMKSLIHLNLPPFQPLPSVVPQPHSPHGHLTPAVTWLSPLNPLSLTLSIVLYFSTVSAMYHRNSAPFLSPSESELEAESASDAFLPSPYTPSTHTLAGLIIRVTLLFCVLVSLVTITLLHFTSILTSFTPSTPPPPPLTSYQSPTGVCVLVRVYQRNYHYVPTFMSLMSHNTHVPNVLFHVTDVNSSVADHQSRVDKANRDAGFEYGHVLNVTAEAVRRRFPELDRVKEFGFAFTDEAMEVLTSEGKYQRMCQWLLITNVDNICTSHFLDRVEQEMALGYQLIGFNTISHYNRIECCGEPQDTSEGSSDDGTRRPINVVWLRGGIDMGAALWNISVWKAFQLNFIELGKQVDHLDQADGQFFVALVERQMKRIAIRQYLFIHQ